MNDTTQSNDSTVTQPKVSARTSSNFFVTPMGRGKVAPQRAQEHEEDDPAAGMGFSIMGSVIGGALGLGPMFEIAFEAIKTGMELSDDKDRLSKSGLDDVNNLNPAAAIRPDLAFNFRSMGDQKKLEERERADDEKRNASKRSWNSGEGQFMLGKLAEKRRDSIGSNPVLPKQSSVVISSMQKKPVASSSGMGKSK